MKHGLRYFTILLLALVVASVSGCEPYPNAGKVGVTCVDEEGNPLEGATIQFCDDKSCQLAESGSNGIAIIEAGSSVYEAKALRAPEGYEIVTTDEISVMVGNVQNEIIFKKEAEPIHFSTKDINGNPVDDSCFEDAEVTMLISFADWCTWCAEEFAFMNSVIDRYGNDGFKVIGVCTLDENDNMTSTIEGIRDEIAEYGISFPVIVRNKDLDFLFINAIPSQVFVSKEKKIMTIDKDCYSKVVVPLADNIMEYYRTLKSDIHEWEEMSEDSHKIIEDSLEQYAKDPQLIYDKYLDYYDTPNGYIDGIFIGSFPEESFDIIINHFLGK